MLLIQKLLPHNQINKLAKKIANCSIKWVKNFLIYAFMQKYKVNLQEAEQSDPFAYKTYNHFFTRKLKPDVRKIVHDPEIIISPCDGCVTQYGKLAKNSLLQTKKYQLNLNDLLTNHIDSEFFNNGKFITIYLAPHNYHRVHMPITGSLKQMVYVPGKLFSVNPVIVNKMPNIFTMNERVISIFDSKIGKLAIILVGAMIVGSIFTTWHGEVLPTKLRCMQSWNYNNIILSRGNEMGLFQLGSTVILIFENHKLDFFSDLYVEKIINMGDRLLYNRLC